MCDSFSADKLSAAEMKKVKRKEKKALLKAQAKALEEKKGTFSVRLHIVHRCYKIAVCLWVDVISRHYTMGLCIYINGAAISAL